MTAPTNAFQPKHDASVKENVMRLVLAEGWPVKRAAEEWGVPPSTASAWLRPHRTAKHRAAKAERAAQLRATGWPVRRIATELGVTPPTIYRWFNGTDKNPPLGGRRVATRRGSRRRPVIVNVPDNELDDVLPKARRQPKDKAPRLSREDKRRAKNTDYYVNRQGETVAVPRSRMPTAAETKASHQRTRARLEAVGAPIPPWLVQATTPGQARQRPAPSAGAPSAPGIPSPFTTTGAPPPLALPFLAATALFRKSDPDHQRPRREHAQTAATTPTAQSQGPARTIQLSCGHTTTWSPYLGRMILCPHCQAQVSTGLTGF